MKNLYVYCEGQTEESFINQVLYPYFFHVGIVVRPIICQTKRTPTQKYKGGVSDYIKIKKELTILCKSHRNEYVTTMFDYYAMPSNTPGIDCREPDPLKRMKTIEAAISADIAEPNCKVHLSLHEFEGLLFSKPESFRLIAGEDVVDHVREIKSSYPTPEHINSSPETAPSKRLEACIPNYAKVTNGTLLSVDMGIDVIMQHCPHFRAWIEELIALNDC